MKRKLGAWICVLTLLLGLSIPASAAGCSALNSIANYITTCPNGNCGSTDATCPNGSCGSTDTTCPNGSCGNTTGTANTVTGGCNIQSVLQQLYACKNGNCTAQDIWNLLQGCWNNGGTMTPTQPVTPAEPETPAQPETPTQPEQPAEPETPVQPETPTPSGCSAQAQSILELVNQQRAANGLGALSLDATLCTVAQVKAQDLHDGGYFSHTSPTYGSPYDLMADYGVTYRTAGENIAMGYGSAQAVVTAWMNSAGHRANILNGNYTTLGVGYVSDGGYWVQEFVG